MWRKLGFYPFTRACLLDAKVKHEVVVLADSTVDLEAGPLLHILMKYEQENNDTVAKINQYCGAGNYLLKETPKLLAQEKKFAVTVPMSRARQGMLGKASTTGALSYANTGGVVNLNDFFIATERKKRSADIALLEKQKNNYEHYVAVADKVKELIEGKSIK